ncbi:MAG: endonuclease V [Deltaproteobacteria bacterium]|nr:endonuclease V [Deltaproteobacteria bacterium]
MCLKTPKRQSSSLRYSAVLRFKSNASSIRSPLLHKGKIVGAVLRTRADVKPVFVSPGYAITLDESIRIILQCGGRYRIPEPVRRAHLLVNRLRQGQAAL